MNEYVMNVSLAAPTLLFGQMEDIETVMHRLPSDSSA